MNVHSVDEKLLKRKVGFFKNQALPSPIPLFCRR